VLLFSKDAVGWMDKICTSEMSPLANHLLFSAHFVGQLKAKCYDIRHVVSAELYLSYIFTSNHIASDEGVSEMFLHSNLDFPGY
jgi:hypothetical protein